MEASRFRFTALLYAVKHMTKEHVLQTLTVIPRESMLPHLMANVSLVNKRAWHLFHEIILGTLRVNGELMN